MIIIGIGNGLLAQGYPSAISTAIVDEMENWRNDYNIGGQKILMMFSGGYEVNKVTEAESMYQYHHDRYGQYCPIDTCRESLSYRTHNNAFEALRWVDLFAVGQETSVIIVDHPAHIKRTKLSFRTAKRLYYKDDKYHLKWLTTEEVYDQDIPGQAYWATKESFAAHEKKSMLLYRFLLFRPWARLGFWLLRIIWPSSKQ